MCKHTDIEEFEESSHAQGADEITLYQWCKNCGALRIIDGYTRNPKWKLPNLQAAVESSIINRRIKNGR